jgi:hypothetical protein
VNYTIRKLRPHLAEQARHRCGYCQTQERISGVPLTVEHLLPESLGGTDEEDNLWMSCRLCNEAKGNRIEWLNPATGDMIPLFNPRTQLWSDHFRWSSDGIFIISLTEIGRATIAALSLNSDLRLKSRAIWVEAGWHPPE